MSSGIRWFTTPHCRRTLGPVGNQGLVGSLGFVQRAIGITNLIVFAAFVAHTGLKALPGGNVTILGTLAFGIVPTHVHLALALGCTTLAVWAGPVIGTCDDASTLDTIPRSTVTRLGALDLGDTDVIVTATGTLRARNAFATPFGARPVNASLIGAALAIDLAFRWLHASSVITDLSTSAIGVFSARVGASTIDAASVSEAILCIGAGFGFRANACLPAGLITRAGGVIGAGLTRTL